MANSVTVSATTIVPNHIASGGFTLMAARYAKISLNLKSGDGGEMTGISPVLVISRSSQNLSSHHSTEITTPEWHYAHSGREQARLGRL
ncbi:hypothetical protein RMS29_023015 [Agrobacterium rosae]|uniref:Uncharacterized protein n=1 Tax=Agrobacterium rosae TaxID=1972867 RepID=A0ABU4VZZ8_9HYPH|nr:hypothetical protein [Agrobacterium rosae]MCM2435015.1 hypothetical protein [Agrobacterium rosae]MDX8330762.1 hypothetical protein [Agrobacterium rosae]